MQRKAEGELGGTVNILRGLKHPKRHLEGSGSAHTHTHTHMKGGVGKGKCHLSTTPERAPRGLCWEDLELRQRLLGHSHSLFHARGIPGNSRSRAVATELWLSQAEKSGCVPGDKQQPLSHCWPSYALEAFPSVLGEQSCRPSQGKSQQLLPSKGCFPALLVAVLPQCWWGDLSECLVFPVCSSQSSVCCASCQPSCGVTGSIRSPKLMQTLPPPAQRAQRGARLPLTSLFLRFFLLDNIDLMSGARKWLHVLPLDTPGPSAQS